MFLPNICITVEYTLDDMNRDLKSWVANEYHQNIHASTGEKPIDRYINDMPNVKINKLTPQQVDDLFYHAIYRTVKNDCTVQISNKLYEVPAAYIGMKVEIRYPLDDPADLRLFENNQQVARLTLLDKNYNAQNTIRYDDDEEGVTADV